MAVELFNRIAERQQLFVADALEFFAGESFA
jgi:hypothetical protein